MKKTYNVDLGEDNQLNITVEQTTASQLVERDNILTGSMLLNYAQGKLLSLQVYAAKQWVATQPHAEDVVIINTISELVNPETDQLFLVQFPEVDYSAIDSMTAAPLFATDNQNGGV